MCQSLADGGRRCSSHQPGTLGTKAYCQQVFNLQSTQVDHTFRKLRRQGSNRPAPTQEQYQQFKNKMLDVVERKIDDGAQKSRMKHHLEKTLTDHQLPDGATFYAMKKLIPRSRDQKREFVQLIKDYAERNNVTRSVAQAKFKELYESTPAGRLTNNWNDDFDATTRYVFNQMNDVNVGTASISEEPRIQREPVPNSSYSVGYDPDDGRLEIETNSDTYAFQNVPYSIAELAQTNPISALQEVRDNNLYAYESPHDAARDAFGRYCQDCHKYKAMRGHVCEPETVTINDIISDESDENDSEEMSLTAAQARIRKSLEEAEQSNEAVDIPLRPQARMTARRRLWTSALEDRERVSLDNTTRARGAGNRPYSTPEVESVKESARQGNVVEVVLERHGDSPSYAREYDRPSSVLMSQNLEFYCDDITGDVKMRMVGEPRCDCVEYANNGRCRHTHSQSDPTRMNNYLKRDVQDFHKRIDPLAHMRVEALNGTLYLKSTRYSSVSIDGENHVLTVPKTRDMQNAKNILTTGGKVKLVEDNSSIVLDRARELNGELSFETNENDFGATIINTLKCRSCGEEEPCEHGRLVQTYFESKILPSNSVVMNAGSRLSALDRIEENDWQSNPSDVQTLLSTFSTGVDQSYTANLDSYISDYRAARDAISQGGNPLPYATENVTDGVCAPGQKAFGIEIEFDIAQGRYPHDVTERVGRRLYDLGLTETPAMMGWHHAARTSNPYSAWSLEYDRTVAAEIVSPILHDTPETWENIRQIYQILEEEGGEGTARCGLHVHMGTINREQGRRFNQSDVFQKNANILHFYSANEDSIRRVQTDPSRKTHRNSSYAPALDRNSIQSSLYNLNAGYGLGIDHRTSVNFGYSDRIEFRGADGTMNASHTQAQVMMNAAIVSAAERGELPVGNDYENLKHQRVGTNARRLEAIRSLTPDATELTDDQLIVSDASYRNFITSLFNTDHGRKMMVGLSAMTPWQR